MKCSYCDRIAEFEISSEAPEKEFPKIHICMNCFNRAFKADTWGITRPALGKKADA